MIVDQATAGRAFAHHFSDFDIEALYESWRARPVDDPLREVWLLIGEISEGVFWAGHIQDADVCIYDLLLTDPRTWPEGRDTLAENISNVARLRALTLDDPAGAWWFSEDLTHTSLGSLTARQVPLAEWETLYVRRKARGSSAW